MQKYPTTAETSVPAKIGIIEISEKTPGFNISGILYKTASIIMGTLSKNEYLAALALSIPRAKAVAIVEPEREIPGIAANP